MGKVLIGQDGKCPNISTCTTTVEEVGYIYMNTIICCVGVCFNIVILSVFLRPSFKVHMTSSMLTYLTALAIADLLAALVMFPVGLVRCIEATSEDLQYASNFYEKYIYIPFGNIFMTTSVWITLTVTAERFIFLYKSGGEITNQSLHRSTSTAVKIVFLILVAAIIFCSPVFFIYEDIDGNQPVERNEFSRSEVYSIHNWIRMFVVKIIPIITVTVPNMLLIKIVKTGTGEMVDKNIPYSLIEKTRKAQNRMTIMLLSISTVFLFSHILEPFGHPSIYSAMFGECSVETAEFESFRMFGIVFERISFASNLISYCFFHRKFLAYVKQLFCCTRIEANSSVQPISTQLSTTLGH